jgi:hypothetical protein
LGHDNGSVEKVFVSKHRMKHYNPSAALQDNSVVKNPRETTDHNRIDSHGIFEWRRA